jgi:hypothetical protein
MLLTKLDVITRINLAGLPASSTGIEEKLIKGRIPQPVTRIGTSRVWWHKDIDQYIAREKLKKKGFTSSSATDEEFKPATYAGQKHSPQHFEAYIITPQAPSNDDTPQVIIGAEANQAQYLAEVIQAIAEALQLLTRIAPKRVASLVPEQSTDVPPLICDIAALKGCADDFSNAAGNFLKVSELLEINI